MNHGSWTGLFCLLFFLPCYDTDAVQRAAKVALMTLFRSIQGFSTTWQRWPKRACCPTRWVSPDSQRARAPGPFFFSGRSGRSQRVHPGSRVARVSTRCRAIQNCQNREPRQQRRRHPSPFSAAPVRGQRATMIHLSFELGARVSLVCGRRRRRRRPSTKAGRGPRNIRATHRWPGSRGGQRLWRPPVTTVSSRCHFGLQLARLGCVTVPCYLLTHTHAGGGRWTVVGKGLGSRLGELGVLTFASARRGYCPVSRQDDETLRAPWPAHGTVWPR